MDVYTENKEPSLKALLLELSSLMSQSNLSNWLICSCANFINISELIALTLKVYYTISACSSYF